jgi:hypothetical protein
MAEYREQKRLNTSAKRLRLSLKIVDEFIDRAKNNTDRNIETLGLIFGYEMKDEILGQYIIIPK